MASRETIEYWWQSIRHRPLSRPQRTVGPNDNNPPKMRFKKFVKLTDYTYACNDLTSFEYEAHAMTGNGSYVNLLKVASKNS